MILMLLQQFNIKSQDFPSISYFNIFTQQQLSLNNLHIINICYALKMVSIYYIINLYLNSQMKTPLDLSKQPYKFQSTTLSGTDSFINDSTLYKSKLTSNLINVNKNNDELLVKNIQVNSNEISKSFDSDSMHKFKKNYKEYEKQYLVQNSSIQKSQSLEPLLMNNQKQNKLIEKYRKKMKQLKRQIQNYQNQLIIKDSIIETFESVYDSYKIEYKKWIDHNNRQQTHRNELIIVEYKKELESKDKIIKNQQQQINTIKKQKKEFQSIIQNLLKQIQNKNSNINEMRSKYQYKEIAVSNQVLKDKEYYYGKLVQCESVLRLRDIQINEKLIRQKVLTQQIKISKLNSQNMKSQLMNFEKQRLSLNKTILQKQNIQKQLRTFISNLQQQKSNLMKKLDQNTLNLLKKQEQIKKLTINNSETINKILIQKQHVQHELMKKINYLNDELTKIQNFQKISEQKKNQMSKLDIQKKELEKKVKQTEKQLSEQTNKINQEAKKVEDLNKKLYQVNIINVKYQQHFIQLKKLQETQLKKRQIQYKKQENQFINLQSLYKKQEKQFINMQSLYKKQESQLKNLQSLYKKQESQLKNLQIQHKKQENYLKNQQQQIKKLENQLKKLQLQIKKQKSNTYNINSLYQKLKEQHQLKSNKILYYQNETNKLGGVIKLLKQDINKLNEQIITIRKNSQLSLQNVQKNNKDIIKKLENKNKQIQSQKLQQINLIKTQLNEMSSKFNKLQQINIQLEKKNKKNQSQKFQQINLIKTQLNEKSSKFNKLQQINKQLENQNKNLKNQLKLSNKKIQQNLIQIYKSKNLQKQYQDKINLQKKLFQDQKIRVNDLQQLIDRCKDDVIYLQNEKEQLVFVLKNAETQIIHLKGIQQEFIEKMKIMQLHFITEIQKLQGIIQQHNEQKKIIQLDILNLVAQLTKSNQEKLEIQKDSSEFRIYSEKLTNQMRLQIQSLKKINMQINTEHQNTLQQQNSLQAIVSSKQNQIKMQKEQYETNIYMLKQQIQTKIYQIDKLFIEKNNQIIFYMKQIERLEETCKNLNMQLQQSHNIILQYNETINEINDDLNRQKLEKVKSQEESTQIKTKLKQNEQNKIDEINYLKQQLANKIETLKDQYAEKLSTNNEENERSKNKIIKQLKMNYEGQIQLKNDYIGKLQQEIKNLKQQLKKSLNQFEKLSIQYLNQKNINKKLQQKYQQKLLAFKKLQNDKTQQLQKQIQKYQILQNNFNIIHQQNQFLLKPKQQIIQNNVIQLTIYCQSKNYQELIDEVQILKITINQIQQKKRNLQIKYKNQAQILQNQHKQQQKIRIQLEVKYNNLKLQYGQLISKFQSLNIDILKDSLNTALKKIQLLQESNAILLKQKSQIFQKNLDNQDQENNISQSQSQNNNPLIEQLDSQIKDFHVQQTYKNEQSINDRIKQLQQYKALLEQKYTKLSNQYAPYQNIISQLKKYLHQHSQCSIQALLDKLMTDTEQSQELLIPPESENMEQYLNYKQQIIKLFIYYKIQPKQSIDQINMDIDTIINLNEYNKNYSIQLLHKIQWFQSSLNMISEQHSQIIHKKDECILELNNVIKKKEESINELRIFVQQSERKYQRVDNLLQIVNKMIITNQLKYINNIYQNKKIHEDLLEKIIQKQVQVKKLLEVTQLQRIQINNLRNKQQQNKIKMDDLRLKIQETQKRSAKLIQQQNSSSLQQLQNLTKQLISLKQENQNLKEEISMIYQKLSEFQQKLQQSNFDDTLAAEESSKQKNIDYEISLYRQFMHNIYSRYDIVMSDINESSDDILQTEERRTILMAIKQFIEFQSQKKRKQSEAISQSYNEFF